MVQIQHTWYKFAHSNPTHMVQIQHTWYKFAYSKSIDGNGIKGIGDEWYTIVQSQSDLIYTTYNNHQHNDICGTRSTYNPPPSSTIGRETVPKTSSWFMMDLLGIKVQPTHYSMRHYSPFDTECERNCRLETSNNSTTGYDGQWVLLLKHINDTSLNHKDATHTWPLSNIQANLTHNNNQESEVLSGFPDVKIIKMNTNSPHDVTPTTQLHEAAVSTNHRNTGTFSKNIIQNLAETIALDKNMDINKPVPHEEWITLANEKQRLQIIRDELLKFIDQNKPSGNTLHGFTQLEQQITQNLLPQLIQSDTSNDNLILNNNNSHKQSIAQDDEKQIQTIQLSLSPTNSSSSVMAKNNNSKSPKSMKKQNSNEQKKKLSSDSKEGYIINDIRGKYFDDNDNINEIDNKFNMKPNNKNKKKNIMELKCDLIVSKQEYILIISDDNNDNSNSDSNNKIIKCEMPDPKTGELIWNPSGVVWLKKEWKLLVGAWNDQENNLIEIRSDNTLRSIDGYGPFHVAMPNGLFMII